MSNSPANRVSSPHVPPLDFTFISLPHPRLASGNLGGLEVRAHSSTGTGESSRIPALSPPWSDTQTPTPPLLRRYFTYPPLRPFSSTLYCTFSNTGDLQKLPQSTSCLDKPLDLEDQIEKRHSQWQTYQKFCEISKKEGQLPALFRSGATDSFVNGLRKYVCRLPVLSQDRSSTNPVLRIREALSRIEESQSTIRDWTLDDIDFWLELNDWEWQICENFDGKEGIHYLFLLADWIDLCNRLLAEPREKSQKQQLQVLRKQLLISASRTKDYTSLFGEWIRKGDDIVSLPGKSKHDIERKENLYSEGLDISYRRQESLLEWSYENDLKSLQRLYSQWDRFLDPTGGLIETMARYSQRAQATLPIFYPDAMGGALRQRALLSLGDNPKEREEQYILPQEYGPKGSLLFDPEQQKRYYRRALLTNEAPSVRLYFLSQCVIPTGSDCPIIREAVEVLSKQITDERQWYPDLTASSENEVYGMLLIAYRLVTELRTFAKTTNDTKAARLARLNAQEILKAIYWVSERESYSKSLKHPAEQTAKLMLINRQEEKDVDRYDEVIMSHGDPYLIATYLLRLSQRPSKELVRIASQIQKDNGSEHLFQKFFLSPFARHLFRERPQENPQAHDRMVATFADPYLVASYLSELQHAKSQEEFVIIPDAALQLSVDETMIINHDDPYFVADYLLNLPKDPEKELLQKTVDQQFKSGSLIPFLEHYFPKLLKKDLFLRDSSSAPVITMRHCLLSHSPELDACVKQLVQNIPSEDQDALNKLFLKKFNRQAKEKELDKKREAFAKWIRPILTTWLQKHLRPALENPQNLAHQILNWECRALPKESQTVIGCHLFLYSLTIKIALDKTFEVETPKRQLLEEIGKFVQAAANFAYAGNREFTDEDIKKLESEFEYLAPYFLQPIAPIISKVGRSQAFSSS